MKTPYCLVLFALAILSAQLDIASLKAQGKVDPAVRARLDREFAAAHPQPGDYLPVCRLHYLSEKIDDHATDIRYAAHGDAKLIVTASLTCPKTRQHLPAIQELKKKYGESLAVTIVYVIEAHPEKDVCPYLGVVDITEANLRDNIRYRQPTTFEGRLQLARQFSKRYPMKAALLVDSMENVAWRTLGQSPNAAILANSEGKVVMRQGWIDPPALVPEIEKLIAQEASDRREREKRFHREHVESEQMQAIMRRLDPDNPNQWEVVRWLEKVDLPHLKALFVKYPKVIEDTLIYGAHDQSEASILQLLIERKDRQLVEATLAAGADVNKQVRESTPLSTAIAVGSLDMVELLLKAGADPKKNPDSDSRSLMHGALLNGRQDIAKRLLEAGVEPDIYTQCGLGQIEAIQSQLDQRPSTGLRYDVAGNLPLSYAVACNQSSVVELLADKGMIAEAGSQTSDSPVERAAKLDTADIMAILLKHISPSEINRTTAVRFALKEGKLAQFKMLLDHKVDTTRTYRGETLLQQSASLDLPIEFAQQLLDHGADLHALTTGYSDDGCGPEDPKSSQETALHLAARSLKPKHVELFLARGAKPDLKDQAGMTPLAASIAETLHAKGDRVEAGLATIQALIAGGCSIEALDSKGDVIRQCVADVLKNGSPAKATQPEENPFLPAYILKPTQYRGPQGLDAKLIPSSPVLERIAQALK